jgi:hypothetical protein
MAQTETRTTTTTTIASVDVRLLLNTLQASQIAVGEWLNVIGYVGAAKAGFPSEQHAVPPPSLSSASLMPASVSTTKTRARHRAWGEAQEVCQLLQKKVRPGQGEREREGDVAQGQSGNGQTEAAIVYVQAVMLWSAGAIQLAEYERILAERQEVEQTLTVN